MVIFVLLFKFSQAKNTAEEYLSLIIDLKTYSMEIKKILINATANLNQVVYSLKLLSWLQEKYNSADFYYLVNTSNESFLSRVPGISGTIPYTSYSGRTGWRMMSLLVNEIRFEEFDMVVHFSASFQPRLACILSHIPVHISCIPFKNTIRIWNYFNRISRFFFKNNFKYSFKRDISYFLEQSSFAGTVFQLKTPEKAYIDSILKNVKFKRLLVFQPGSFFIKDALARNLFIDIINEILSESDNLLVLIGSTYPRQLINLLYQKKLRFINLTKQSEILHLAALLKKAHIFITDEDGPYLLSAAQQTPVIVFRNYREKPKTKLFLKYKCKILPEMLSGYDTNFADISEDAQKVRRLIEEKLV